MQILSKSKTLRLIQLMIAGCFALFTLSSQAADYYLINNEIQMTSDLRTLFSLQSDTIESVFIYPQEYTDLATILDSATSTIPDYEIICNTDSGSIYLFPISDLSTIDLSLCNTGLSFDRYFPNVIPSMFIDLFAALGTNNTIEPPLYTDPTAIEVNARIDELELNIISVASAFIAMFGFASGLIMRVQQ